MDLLDKAEEWDYNIKIRHLNYYYTDVQLDIFVRTNFEFSKNNKNK
jgi:hypothetical protein